MFRSSQISQALSESWHRPTTRKKREKKETRYRIYASRVPRHVQASDLKQVISGGPRCRLTNQSSAKCDHENGPSRSVISRKKNRSKKETNEKKNVLPCQLPCRKFCLLPATRREKDSSSASGLMSRGQRSAHEKTSSDRTYHTSQVATPHFSSSREHRNASYF